MVLVGTYSNCKIMKVHPIAFFYMYGLSFVKITAHIQIAHVCGSKFHPFRKPILLLSGFMFPFRAMPVPAQWLGELLPLTHYVRLCRGILLRGAPLSEQLASLGALALICLLALVAASRLFRKELG